MGVTGRWYDVSPFFYENLYSDIRNCSDVWHLGAQEARDAFIPHPCVSRSDLAASCFSTVISRVTMLMETGKNTICGHVSFVQTSIRLRFGLGLSRRPLQLRQRRHLYCSGDAEIIQHMQHWLREGYIFA